jgi:hypothetical protein
MSHLALWISIWVALTEGLWTLVTLLLGDISMNAWVVRNYPRLFSGNKRWSLGGPNWMLCRINQLGHRFRAGWACEKYSQGAPHYVSWKLELCPLTRRGFCFACTAYLVSNTFIPMVLRSQDAAIGLFRIQQCGKSPSKVVSPKNIYSCSSSPFRFCTLLNEIVGWIYVSLFYINEMKRLPKVQERKGLVQWKLHNL